MSRKKYKVDMDAVREIRESTDDDLDQYLFSLYNRASTLIDDSELPKAAIVLELMRSTFVALEDGKTHETISTAYPVKAWREERVEIPLAWLRVLVDGWSTYLDGPAGQSIGEALGLEGGGQGKPKAKDQLEALNKRQKISNEVASCYLNALVNDEAISWEDACGIAAEALDISDRTAKRASEQLRHRLIQKLTQLGIIIEV